MTGTDPGAQRLREAFAALSERAVPRDDCPRPDLLWAACRGELPREEVLRLVAHTVDCGVCAEAWRLARELRMVGSAPVVARSEAPRRAWWGSWTSLAAAAGVTALAFSALLRLPDTVPGERAPGVVAIRALEDGRRLPRDRAVLRWTPGPPESRYDVHVATEDLRTVTRARGLALPELALPPTALVGVPRGSRLLWRVEVLLPDGRRVASPTFIARLE